MKRLITILVVSVLLNSCGVSVDNSCTVDVTNNTDEIIRVRLDKATVDGNVTVYESNDVFVEPGYTKTEKVEPGRYVIIFDDFKGNVGRSDIVLEKALYYSVECSVVDGNGIMEAEHVY